MPTIQPIGTATVTAAVPVVPTIKLAVFPNAGITNPDQTVTGITFTVDNPLLASVASSGQGTCTITPLGTGTVTITATGTNALGQVISTPFVVPLIPVTPPVATGFVRLV